MYEISWTGGSEAHIARHNVTPEEVEEALGRPRHSYSGREGTTIVLGRTNAGRYLLIVLVESVDGRWFVATARDMTANEKRTYARKAQ